MEKIRREIDRLDTEIRKKLEERFALSEKIGEEKKRQHLPVQNRAREEEILSRITGEKGTQSWAIRRSYEEIFRLSRALQQKEKGKLYISGMPGAGKSTLGRLLAERFGVDFLDLDEKITERYGKVNRIFQEKGECFFREKETEVLLETLAFRGIVALGGGSLLKEENRKFLEKGWLLYLHRSVGNILQDIRWENRPLLVKEKGFALEKLWEKRGFLYENFNDFIQINENSMEQVLGAMAEKVNFIFDQT